MVQTTGKHVFISYSRKDNDVMRRIVDYLRSQKINVWLDNERLVPGTPVWEEEIERAISGSSAVVVILSPDAKKSVWVRREISLAEQYRKRIFPIMVAGDEDSSIPLRLITNQFVDARKNEMGGVQTLKAAVMSYLEGISKTDNTMQATDPNAARKNDVQFLSVSYVPEPVQEIIENLRSLQLRAKLISFFQSSVAEKPEESWFRSFLLSLFWFFLFLVAPPFALALFPIHIQNVVMLFWISLLIFGGVGITRTWRKEALVASSAILGIAFNYVMRRYISLVYSYSESDVSLFWIRAITLEVLVYLGYKLGRLTVRKRGNSAPTNIQDKGLGFLAGAFNGYLIIGSLLYYNHIADYPFWNVILKTTDPNLQYSINSMMIYMAPQLLGEPAIYFAVILVIMIVLIILM